MGGKRRNKPKKKKIKKASKLRIETQKLDEEEARRLESELKKIRESEEQRYQEEVNQLKSRISTIEIEKTEEDLFQEEQSTLESTFEKDKAKIDDEECAAETRHQLRMQSIIKMPEKNKELLSVHVSVKFTSNPTTIARELVFKCFGTDVVNTIVTDCIKIFNVHKQADEVTIFAVGSDDVVDFFTEFENLPVDDKGTIKLCVLIPNDDEDDNIEKGTYYLWGGEMTKTSVVGVLEAYDVEIYGYLEGGTPSNDLDQQVHEEAESSKKKSEKDSEDDGEDEDEKEEESEIQKLVELYASKLKDISAQTMYDLKNKLRQKYEKELKSLEEESKTASKKYARAKQRIEKIFEEKAASIFRVRKRLQEKIKQMQEAYENSEEYRQISVCLPREITVSYNGKRAKVDADTITTLEQVIQQAHIALEIPLSNYSYLQDNKTTPPTIYTAASEISVSVLFFGSQYIQLSLRLPEEEAKEQQLKVFRNTEETDFDIKAELLKNKVKANEITLLGDIPWPSFLQKVTIFSKVTCFQVFNVFVEDSPEYIKKMMKKKLLWWHPDKLLWKHSTLHEEHEIIIKERQTLVIHHLTQHKPTLNNWLEDMFLAKE